MTAPILNTPVATQTESMQPISPSLAEALPLRDIHLPESISWWPLAHGWWVLLASLIFITALYFIVKKIRYSRRLKRASRDEFNGIKNQYMNDKNKIQLVKQLSIFLRRVCISFYPRHNTASLTGEDWLNFLDSTFGNKNKQSSQINSIHSTELNGSEFNSANFNSETGMVLLTAPYLPEDNTATHINADALLDICERWLNVQPVKHQFKHSSTKNVIEPITPSAHKNSLATSDIKQ